MPKGSASELVEETFAATDSGTSLTTPKQCSALRKNEVAMIKNRPCKIVEMSTSKTGKHGHAKVHMVGIDIFDGKKQEDICPSTHNMDVPTVKTTNYQLIDIEEGGYVTLLDEKTVEQKSDLQLPDDNVGKEIQSMFDDGKEITVTVTSACGREKITGCKAMTTN